jgi:hypothetical protein
VFLIDSIDLNKKEEFFSNFISKYNELSNNLSKKLYVCIDCEFNSRKIALIQINFEEDNDGNIFILDPNILSKDLIDQLKNEILCNVRIAKIFHGADSLDIPYFFYEFFESNEKQIVKFMTNYIDTRFLCEYMNSYDKLYNNKDNNLCNIYYLYEKYDVINKDQRNILDKNENEMGKLYNIIINIDTLSDELINYTMYDVVYLKYLYKRMISSIVEYRYVNELVRLVFLDKRNIIKFVDKEKIERYNINYFFKDNKIVRLSENIEKNKIFNNRTFNALYHVNYFKLNLNLILKNIIYAKIIRRERVYENKSKLQKNVLEYNSLFEKLKLFKFDNLFNLIMNLDI